MTRRNNSNSYLRNRNSSSCNIRVNASVLNSTDEFSNINKTFLKSSYAIQQDLPSSLFYNKEDVNNCIINGSMKDIHSYMSKRRLSSSISLADIKTNTNNTTRNRSVMLKLDYIKQAMLNKTKKENTINKPIANPIDSTDIKAFLKFSPVELKENLMVNGPIKKKKTTTIFNNISKIKRQKHPKVHKPFFFESEVDSYKRGFAVGCN